MELIATVCPHCNGTMEVPPKFTGLTLLCTRCLEPFVVTAADAVAALTLRPDSSPPEDRAEAETLRGDAPPPDTGPAILGRVGRFELRRFLGQGAFGKVYLAYDPQLDRDVALKVPKLAPDHPEDADRFLREGKATSRLKHPGIVTVYEAGRAGAAVYIAAEYVAGVPLSVYLTESSPDAWEAARIVRDLARAMAYAHTEGVVHRDLKPANVLIGQDGSPRVTDFGLARRVGETTLTGDAGPVGTPAYMAPEQARGETAGPAADVYALGAILYELVTGKPPFAGAPQEVVVTVARSTRPPDPRDVRAVPRDVAAITRRAMEPESEDRYGGARELAEDLERWLDGRTVVARPKLEDEQLRWASRLWWVAAAVGIPLLLALAVAANDFFFKDGLFQENPQGLTRYRQGAKDAGAWVLKNPPVAAVAAIAVLVPVTVAALAISAAAGYRWMAALRTETVNEFRKEAERADRMREIADERLAHEAAKWKAGQAALQTVNGRLRSTAYARDLAVAQLWLLRGDRRAAEVVLAACPADLRGWEWELLNDAASSGLPGPAPRWVVRGDEHGTRALAVAFSVDGRRVIVGGGASVTSFDATSGVSCEPRAEDGVPLPRAANDTGRAMAESLDRRRVVSADADGVIRSTDADTGQEVFALTLAGTAVIGVALSPDGRYLVTVAATGTVTLWGPAR